jgi:hypothetical protein
MYSFCKYTRIYLIEESISIAYFGLKYFLEKRKRRETPPSKRKLLSHFRLRELPLAFKHFRFWTVESDNVVPAIGDR